MIATGLFWGIGASGTAQAACEYYLSARAHFFYPWSFTHDVEVDTEAGCQWSVVNTNSWIVVGTGTSVGAGKVTFTVEENTSPTPRTGVLKIAGKNYIVAQMGAYNESSGTQVADFDGNGWPDVMLQNAKGALRLWTMDGATRTGVMALTNVAIKKTWKVAGFADFDRDGHNDLLLQHTNGAVSFAFMEGTTLVRRQPLRKAASGWRAVSVNDFDNDGNMDVLFQHTGGRLAVWLLNGTTFIRSVLLRNGVAAPPGWRVVGTADFNPGEWLPKGGEPDILFQHTDGRSAIWFMNGLDFVISTPVLRNNAFFRRPIIGIADMNDDTFPDLIFKDPNGTPRVAYMEVETVTAIGNLTDVIKGIPRGWRVVVPK